MSPKNPIFRSGQLLDSTFSTWTAQKDPPFQKYTFVWSTFPTWAAPKDPLLIIYVSLLFSDPKSPSFFSEGPLWKTPPPTHTHFQLGGRSLSPHFQTNSRQHIYTTFMYEYPKGSVSEYFFIFYQIGTKPFLGLSEAIRCVSTFVHLVLSLLLSPKL